MDSIGKIIKCRRKEFGLTQSRLAELSKIGINTLTQIERGEGNPTIKVLEKVLRTLGMQLTATIIEL
ncbi:MAG: helix-turn-helix domain-containing protein [Bacteroidales bacterium]|nr:helix-turn-helix domain-containing protein [Bacteroidales bacterium]